MMCSVLILMTPLFVGGVRCQEPVELVLTVDSQEVTQGQEFVTRLRVRDQGGDTNWSESLDISWLVWLGYEPDRIQFLEVTPPEGIEAVPNALTEVQGIVGLESLRGFELPHQTPPYTQDPDGWVTLAFLRFQALLGPIAQLLLHNDPPELYAPVLGTTQIWYCRQTRRFSPEALWHGSIVFTRAFVRSDTNGDGQSDMADVMDVLNFLFLGTFTMDCPDAADSNDDGVVNISDPIYAVNFLVLGGPPPEAPFHQAGGDPSFDELRCDQSP